MTLQLHSSKIFATFDEVSFHQLVSYKADELSFVQFLVTAFLSPLILLAALQFLQEKHHENFSRKFSLDISASSSLIIT